MYYNIPFYSYHMIFLSAKYIYMEQYNYYAVSKWTCELQKHFCLLTRAKMANLLNTTFQKLFYIFTYYL